MAGQLPGYPSQDTTTMRDTPSASVQIDIQCLKSKWYFSKQEIENYSPSRKDGIEFEKETALRKLYCSFLQELGMELKVPQVTIATAMMLCHRFYMRQSHAKNDWQTIATVSMFLACKAEETPCWLIEVTVVAYKLMYRWDPSAPQRIKQKDVYDKQKELILIGERLLLSTIAFDFNMELPYKPLVGALKRLEISNKELAKVAWNFVNDWLRTTLCLQYKPHYIAAGCLFLAAKLQQVKLPTEKERVWWMQFDVSPKQLEEVIQEMLRHLEKNRKRAVPPMLGKMVECKPGISKSKPNIPPSATTCSSNINQYLINGATVEAGVFAKPALSDNSPQSCIVNGSNVGHGATVNDGLVKFAPTNCSENEASSDSHAKKQESICHQTSDCGSANSVVEDGDGEPKAVEPNSNSKSVSVQVGNNKIDVNRIREALKRKRRDITVNKKLVEAVNDEIDSEAWIEMELENGIELEIAHADKRRKI